MNADTSMSLTINLSGMTQTGMKLKRFFLFVKTFFCSLYDMVIFCVKMPAIQKKKKLKFLTISFILRHMSDHRDFAIWPNITNFNRVLASDISNQLVKTLQNWSIRSARIFVIHRQTHRHIMKKNQPPQRFHDESWCNARTKF